MSERSEIRAALNAIKTGGENSVTRQLASAVLQRFAGKVLAKYGSASTVSNPDLPITNEERADVRTCMGIVAILQRSDMVALNVVKAEVVCEQAGFFDTPKLPEADTFDSPDWKTLESALIDQVEKCETPEEIQSVQQFYEWARASYAVDAPPKNLRVYGGEKAT